MSNTTRTRSRLTYAQSGVNRTARERSRYEISSRILRDSYRYRFGKPVRLPFGLVYPSGLDHGAYYDLQIEGVGTKTLLAELTGRYDTIGIDAVAMAVNDVIRSGAVPLLVSDAIHIAGSDRERVTSLIRGIREGAIASNCIISSGETGNVQELLHSKLKNSSPPFDLIVSCLGIAKKRDLIFGDISVGDAIIGLRSSGIHSNGLTLARKLLLKPWGGRYDPWFRPPSIRRSLVEELMEPTAIYSSALTEAKRSCRLKAAIHITGDGFAKFRRLLGWQRKFKQSRAGIGLKFEGLRRMPPIFRLIYDAAKARGSPIALAEMFRTFNMGYGFAVIVPKREIEPALASFNKRVRAEMIGVVTDDGRISVSTPDSEKLLIL
jgi:phosphoribosylformylglycinamidine cyclo-ligase